MKINYNEFSNLNIGQLTNQLTILHFTPTKTKSGGITGPYTPTKTFWCLIVPYISNLTNEKMQRVAEIQYNIYCRYRDDISIKDRFLFEEKTLYLMIPPVDPDGRKYWMFLQAKEYLGVDAGG